MMADALICFHGDLDYFLADDGQGAAVAIPLDEDRPAVKHPIEALGVPHTEVGAIRVNDVAVDFAYRLAPGDRIDVYGLEAAESLPEAVPLQPDPPAPARFVADTHLGQLARYLRLFGFDTLYPDDYADDELARISAGDGRILLTRDRGLLKRKIIRFGYCVRSTDPRRQIGEVIRRYDLSGEVRPWQRCVRCNGMLQPVEKEAILHCLEPKTRLYYDEFQQCDGCGQIYWQGSHFQRMQAFIAEVT